MATVHKRQSGHAGVAESPEEQLLERLQCPLVSTWAQSARVCSNIRLVEQIGVCMLYVSVLGMADTAGRQRIPCCLTYTAVDGWALKAEADLALVSGLS